MIARPLCLLSLIFATFAPSLAHADSATWDLNPVTGDWNTPANWTPATVPSAPGDIATFGTSSITTVGVSDSIEIGGIVFQPGASVYTIGPNPHYSFVLSGAGVTNNSGVTQHLLAGPTSTLAFYGSASAGSKIEVTVVGATNTTLEGAAGHLQFSEASSAGGGIYTSDGSLVNNNIGGFTEFFDNSTAANGTFTMNGGKIPGARGASTIFYTAASAGNATFTLNGGVAGSQETYLEFDFDSTADGARVILNGNSTLYVRGHNAPGLTLGSVEGNGKIVLASFKARTLTVGSLGLDATFSGLIDDEGAVGSLTKIGKGRLTFTGANTYLGTTLVRAGQLLVNNTIGSGTGAGAVQVSAGTLGGSGTIAGPVTVATPSKRATLTPGRKGKSIGTLTLQSSLLLNIAATYQCGVDSSNGTADRLVANGVTINGATFTPQAVGSGSMALGTVLTVIANGAATPILGTFSNLADGATISVGANNFQANYEGGDGNDLTLTVVP